MHRRGIVRLGLLFLMQPGMLMTKGARSEDGLLTIPVELAGNWRNSLPADVSAVIARMREACLTGLTLRSDRAPTRLRVDDHTSGPPYIWLHNDVPTVAWIVVDVETRDWCKLAYQFGHELGHVLANSWTADATPGGPCQWLEEALVEAFSIHGLGKLASLWKARPPFPNDQKYADAILEYRERMLRPDVVVAQAQSVASDSKAWFREHQRSLEANGTVDGSRPLIPSVVALYDTNFLIIEDLCALNRWPDRTHVSLVDYLENWKRSCKDLGTPGKLPSELRTLLIQ